MRSREPVRTLVPIARPAPAPPSEPVAPAAIAEHARQLVARMLDELDTITSLQGELEDAIVVATANDDDDRRRDAMLKAVSLPARSQIAKNLATTLKTISEAAAPQGKKAAAQERASAAGRKFGSIGAPTSKAIN